jgi:hypothetical protein
MPQKTFLDCFGLVRKLPKSVSYQIRQVEKDAELPLSESGLGIDFDIEVLKGVIVRNVRERCNHWTVASCAGRRFWEEWRWINLVFSWDQ